MAGSSSNWFKLETGLLKGKRVFVSNAALATRKLTKAQIAKKGSLSLADKLKLDQRLHALSKLSKQPAGQAQAKPQPPKKKPGYVKLSDPTPEKPAAPAEPAAPTIQPAFSRAAKAPRITAATGRTPGRAFNETNERAKVLDGNTVKPGVTKDQAKRYFDRRQVAQDAATTKYSHTAAKGGGVTTAKAELDKYAADGWSATLVKSTHVRLTKGSEEIDLTAKHKVMRRYAQVVWNLGDLARNY